MGSFSQAIKNLFKRGKRERNGTDEASRVATTNGSPSNLHAKDDLPPNLPAIKPSSTFTAEQPLSQIHGLATTEGQETTDISPMDQDTKSESPLVGESQQARKSDISRVSEQNDQGNLIANGIPVDKRHSMAVSALGEDTRQDTPPKVDGAADASSAAVPEAAAAAALISEPTKTTTTATFPANGIRENIDPAATATKEVEPPVARTDEAKTSSLEKPEGQPVAPIADDGKIAVQHEEPPSIPSTKVAPGMYATSGPLEDFPEGV